MQITQQFEVKVPMEKAFASLQDVQLLASCLPGCKDLKQLNDKQYAAVIEIAIAFMKLKFNVEVEITEAVAPSSLKAKVTGKPMALAGNLTMAADLLLTEITPNETRVSYAIEMGITGKLGSVGQSAFRAKAEEMGGLFAQKLKATLEGEQAGVVA